jgi:hypothetical protein
MSEESGEKYCEVGFGIEKRRYQIRAADAEQQGSGRYLLLPIRWSILEPE